jgi:hypothetical protein
VVEVPRKASKSGVDPFQETRSLLNDAKIDPKLKPKITKAFMRALKDNLDHSVRFEAEADLGANSSLGYRSVRGQEKIIKLFRDALGVNSFETYYETFMHELDHAIADAVRNKVRSKGGSTRFDIRLSAENKGLGGTSYQNYMSAEEFGTHWNDLGRVLYLQKSPEKSRILAQEQYVESVLVSEGQGKSHQEKESIRRKAEADFGAIRKRFLQQELTESDRKILGGIRVSRPSSVEKVIINSKLERLRQKSPVMEEMMDQSIDILNGNRWVDLKANKEYDGGKHLGYTFKFTLPNSRKLSIFVPEKHSVPWKWDEIESYIRRYFDASKKEQAALAECLTEFESRLNPFIRRDPDPPPNYLEQMELERVMKRVSFTESMLDAHPSNGKSPKSFSGIAEQINNWKNRQNPVQSP